MPDQPVTLTDQEREGMTQGQRMAADYAASAERFPADPRRDEVNAVAFVLIDAWNRAEKKDVGVSYIATHADMARAVLDSEWLAERDRAAFERGRQALADQVRDVLRRKTRAVKTLRMMRSVAALAKSDGIEKTVADVRAVLPPVVVDAHTSSSEYQRVARVLDEAADWLEARAPKTQDGRVLDPGKAVSIRLLRERPWVPRDAHTSSEAVGADVDAEVGRAFADWVAAEVRCSRCETSPTPCSAHRAHTSSEQEDDRG